MKRIHFLTRTTLTPLLLLLFSSPALANYDLHVNTILSLSLGIHEGCWFEPGNGDGHVDQWSDGYFSRGASRRGSLHCPRSGIGPGLAGWGFPQDAITAVERAIQMQRQDYLEHISTDGNSVRSDRWGGEGPKVLVSFMKLFRMRLHPENDADHVRIVFSISSVVHELPLDRRMRENIEDGTGLLPNQLAIIRFSMQQKLDRLTSLLVGP